jgi:hypothetical protein
MPSIGRAGTLRLLHEVLHFLGKQADPRDYMFNRVLEVSEDGEINAYILPR